MKYHIVGWIDGEKKNPPRFLVAANPVKEKKFSLFRSKPEVNWEIDKNTVCFVLPYSMEWFNVIDKHQCDKEEGIVVEWEPDMNDYVSSPQILSGEEHEGWMHKELARQQAAIKAAKEKKQKEKPKPKSKKYFLPPVDDFGRRYRKILRHEVLLYGATVTMVTDNPGGGFSWGDDGTEYFLFPAAKGKEILDAASKLEPTKHEFWNPDLSEFYEGKIGINYSEIGTHEYIVHISKELPDEVLDNLNLLQL
ncbi:MAG: Uncharacterized protein AUK63_2302 [bacterium P3]|mgnify:CR=1 FL=1|nr:MAG: Uncharacterized protein AUK63_2302 [bacterium P3]